MTTPPDVIPEATPGTAASAPAAGTPRAASRGTRRFLLWWLGLSTLVMFTCALCLAAGLYQFDPQPLHVFINGDEVTQGLTMTGFSDGAKAALAAGGMLAAILLLLMLPLLLLLTFAVLTVVLFVSLVVPVLALALVIALATSPFWLVALVVWLLARRRASHDYARTKIAA